MVFVFEQWGVQCLLLHNLNSHIKSLLKNTSLYLFASKYDFTHWNRSRMKVQAPINWKNKLILFCSRKFQVSFCISINNLFAVWEANYSILNYSTTTLTRILAQFFFGAMYKSHEWRSQIKKRIESPGRYNDIVIIYVTNIRGIYSNQLNVFVWLQSQYWKTVLKHTNEFCIKLNNIVSSFFCFWKFKRKKSRWL